MLKVLITGVSGFVGRRIVLRFLNENPDVKIWNLGRTPVEGTIFLDICEFGDFKKIDIKFDLVIHALAMVGEKYCTDFFEANELNVNLTKSILQYITKNPSVRLIYLSSIIIYSNKNVSPVKETDAIDFNYTNYSFTKGIAEEYVKYITNKHCLNTVILRVSNLYGPGQKYDNSPYLISEKIVQAINEGKVEVRNQDTKRDWIYIDDLISAVSEFINNKSLHGIFNIGSGYSISVGEIGNIIAETLNVPFSSLDLPVSGPQSFFADITKVTSLTGWKPKIQIREGIINQILYIQNHLN